jgi:hypothetical protein
MSDRWYSDPQLSLDDLSDSLVVTLVDLPKAETYANLHAMTFVKLKDADGILLRVKDASALLAYASSIKKITKHRKKRKTLHQDTARKRHKNRKDEPRNISGLNPDIHIAPAVFRYITKFLDYVDVIRIRGVCKSWQRVQQCMKRERPDPEAMFQLLNRRQMDLCGRMSRGQRRKYLSTYMTTPYSLHHHRLARNYVACQGNQWMSAAQIGALLSAASETALLFPQTIKAKGEACLLEKMIAATLAEFCDNDTPHLTWKVATSNYVRKLVE